MLRSEERLLAYAAALNTRISTATAMTTQMVAVMTAVMNFGIGGMGGSSAMELFRSGFGTGLIPPDPDDG